MTTTIHNLGFPRIGAKRELKSAVEAYWAGKLSAVELEAVGAELRKRHWQQQASSGVQKIPVGDFAWYDQILEWSTTIGAIPKRFGQDEKEPVSIDTLFRMGRGRAPTGTPAAACEMTKWFDTNYHFITPEIWPGQKYRLARDDLFKHVSEAQADGHNVKVVIPGPLTWLWFAKGDEFEGNSDASKLFLLDNLLPVYSEVLKRLSGQGVEWVQIDEPILILDLPLEWRVAFSRVYNSFSELSGIKLLVATYFGGLRDNVDLALSLKVNALHIDAVRDREQLAQVVEKIGADKILSVGIIDGRNIWRTDLDSARSTLLVAAEKLGDRLWIAPSCSLLHVPVDLSFENELDEEVKSWLSFAIQKIEELSLLGSYLDGGLNVSEEVSSKVLTQRNALNSRSSSSRTHNPVVREKVDSIKSISLNRVDFSQRRSAQQKKYNLPLFPTTTIGSFPQTADIRSLRRRWKNGSLNTKDYEACLRKEVAQVIGLQEEIGLDVLVHGEPERNDMVEYFGELLDGFAFTKNGWVQSYGSRCVKPPIIFGDIYRPSAMTVEWSSYAQSLTSLPVKGMLTGPVTMLQWSFVRDDQPREFTCKQLAIVLREEVLDLERAGISIIQIDEPAIREGLPLRKSDWEHYLQWAVDCFKVTTSGVQEETQIHTHMCYSEFNDIIVSIAAMDADVITIETSRSNMELLKVFEKFSYPNEIGPGVYDIHSPNVPTVDWMVQLIKRATSFLSKEQIWVNPDCGLKTRGPVEAKEALVAMVEAARLLRKEFSN